MASKRLRISTLGECEQVKPIYILEKMSNDSREIIKEFVMVESSAHDGTIVELVGSPLHL